MRKDVRFGLTIGAILLAVLVVYVLVVPGGEEPDLVTLDTLDPVTTEDLPTEIGPSILDQVTPPAGQQVRVEADTPDNAPAVTETPQVAASNQQFDWDAMLTHGRLIAVEQPRGTRPQSTELVTPRQDTARPSQTPTETTTVRTPAGAQTYIVKSGDNFWTIAQAMYGDGRHFKLIEQANRGVNSSNLRIGQELRLPAAPTASSSAQPQPGNADSASPVGDRQYRVVANDSLHRISQKLYGDGSRWEEIYQLNRQTIGGDPAKLKLGMVLQLPEAPTAVSASR